MPAKPRKPRPPVYPHPPTRETECRRCGAPTRTGMDGAVAACHVVLDAEPLGRPGEPGVMLRAVVALLSRRPLVELDDSTWRVHDMDAYRLRGVAEGLAGPGKPRRGLRLMAGHVCPERASGNQMKINENGRTK